MKPERPLSPHLSIYKPQISSVLSITHRFTGIVLYAGSVLLALWLWSAAYNADCFHAIHDFMGSPLGQVLLVGWTAAFYYHLYNGIRHLWWDTGRGLTLPALARSGWTVVLATVALTALTWWRVLGGMQ